LPEPERGIRGAFSFSPIFISFFAAEDVYDTVVIWILGFRWDLGLGIWDFPKG